MEKNILPKRKGQTKIEYCKDHYGKGFQYIDREVDRANGKKKCGVCKKLITNTSQFFHRNPQTKDGLHYNCKKCRNDAKRAYYEQKFKKTNEV